MDGDINKRKLLTSSMIEYNDYEEEETIKNNVEHEREKGLLIGLSGKFGAGKTTIQRILEKKSYVRVNMADILKQTLSLHCNIPLHLLEGETEESRIFRESPVEEKWQQFFQEMEIFSKYKKEGKKITWRIVMNVYGAELFRNMVHKNYWIQCTMQKIEHLLKKGENVVVGDVRYENEKDMIKQLGGKLWFVTRENSENNIVLSDPNHSSNKTFTEEFIDEKIENNGTIEELELLVDSIMNKRSSSN
jgi:hypothetical protein